MFAATMVTPTPAHWPFTFADRFFPSHHRTELPATTRFWPVSPSVEPPTTVNWLAAATVSVPGTSNTESPPRRNLVLFRVSA